MNDNNEQSHDPEVQDELADLLADDSALELVLDEQAFVVVFNKKRQRYDILTLQFNSDFPQEGMKIIREETNHDNKIMAQSIANNKYVQLHLQRERDGQK